jgi:hypothetical protein
LFAARLGCPQLIRESGLNIIAAADLDDAAVKAVESIH